MAKAFYPKNPFIKNGVITELYLKCLRNRWRILGRLLGQSIGCEIGCIVPSRLFIPHPNGIVVDTHCRIGNNVVLLQQVTLGVSHPYYDSDVPEWEGDPRVDDGVFVGAGAKILGHVTVGEWSVIGANAVITEDVAPDSIVVGSNRVLKKKASQLKWLPATGDLMDTSISQRLTTLRPGSRL